MTEHTPEADAKQALDIEQRDSNTAMVVALLRLDNTLRECTARILSKLEEIYTEIDGLSGTRRRL